MSSETVAAVLLAAVPAVLALGLPLSLWFARARARAAGVFLDGARAIAAGSRVDTVLLDRWGTVTTGQLRVVAVEPVEPDHERNLRWFAGALGHAADDPVSRAIARLSSRGKLSQVRQHEGGGISGSVDRHPVRLGRPDWLGMESRDDTGVTVGVQVDSRPIGYITVADDVRPHAADGVARLRSAGIVPVLVSEDSERNTRSLAEACGVEEWYADRPADGRDELVEERRRRGRVVAAAGPTAPGNADLVLTEDPPGPEAGSAGQARIRLADLDVGRVATALAVTRSAARGAARSRRTGLAVGVAGVVLSVTGVLSLPLAAGYAALGSATVVAVAGLSRTGPGPSAT